MCEVSRVGRPKMGQTKQDNSSSFLTGHSCTSHYIDGGGGGKSDTSKELYDYNKSLVEVSSSSSSTSSSLEVSTDLHLGLGPPPLVYSTFTSPDMSTFPLNKGLKQALPLTRNNQKRGYSEVIAGACKEVDIGTHNGSYEPMYTHLSVEPNPGGQRPSGVDQLGDSRGNSKPTSFLSDSLSSSTSTPWETRLRFQEVPSVPKTVAVVQKRAGCETPIASATPLLKGQVVGWPPVRSFRKQTLAASPHSGKPSGEEESLYVKVNMDGIPIGRKLDLNAYNHYPALLHALEEMFQPSSVNNGYTTTSSTHERSHFHFFSGSEYALTYEDKDGDWMLVGDVPWEMFINTVRRLRIMKNTDLSG